VFEWACDPPTRPTIPLLRCCVYFCLFGRGRVPPVLTGPFLIPFCRSTSIYCLFGNASRSPPTPSSEFFFFLTKGDSLRVPFSLGVRSVCRPRLSLNWSRVCRRSFSPRKGAVVLYASPDALTHGRRSLTCPPLVAPYELSSSFSCPLVYVTAVHAFALQP